MSAHRDPLDRRVKRLRCVSWWEKKNVSCEGDETLVSVVCSSGAPDGASCPSAGETTGLCVHK